MLILTDQFVRGATMIGFCVIGLFFLRYWRKTHDRLFSIFAIAFWFLAIEQILLASTRPQDEIRPYIYLVRLFAFLLLIVAIIDKNRNKGAR